MFSWRFGFLMTTKLINLPIGSAMSRLWPMGCIISYIDSISIVGRYEIERERILRSTCLEIKIGECRGSMIVTLLHINTRLMLRIRYEQLPSKMRRRPDPRHGLVLGRSR